MDSKIVIILSILLLIGIIYVYLNNNEYFERSTFLSNGNILWYPKYQIDPNVRYNDTIQPYIITCSKESNFNLCKYLRTHQDPVPNFIDTRSYPEYALSVAQSGEDPFNMRPFDATW